MEHQQFRLHIAAASPLEKYPAKQHARRVAEFLGVEKGLIYLPGAPTAYLEDSDQFVPFRQRRYFYYLSGVDESDCHLTYDIRLDTLMLYVPAPGSPRKVYYNGRGSTPEEALEKYDIDAVHWATAVADYVEFWMTQHEGDVYILHPDQAVVPGHDKSPRVNYTKLQAAIDAARVRKDQHEIKLIRKANDISAKAHANVLRNILRFKNEAQVEASFLDTCVAADAKHQAYEIIAASGANAATLHYIKNDEPFGDRQLMCLDAGCEWQCYASDVTRTFPLTGQWPSKEAKEIHDLVLKIQTKCIEAIRPGARYLDIHYLAHRILIDGLLELGIFHHGTAQEIFDAGTSLAFLPHGLGHHLGLEVHDVSDVPLMAAMPQTVSSVVDLEMCKAPVRPSSPALEEGMIVTVEPGIYFNRYALSAVYFPDPTHSKYINRNVLVRYLPVGGVRIEDDILVTDNGYENLTTAPKGEEMLRIIQEGSGEAVSKRQPRRPQPRSREQTYGSHPVSSAESPTYNGIEVWSRAVNSGRSHTLDEMPVPPDAKGAVELEGHETTPTTPKRSRPVSLSAAPASFEATGWPTHYDSVAAELPSEPRESPQSSGNLGRQPSHWRKVPPALARMASTQSLSNRSLPEYTPSQMFQRPRQAPAPPEKLPELPAKPLAYRQSMPIIISGSNSAKPSASRSPFSSRGKPTRDQTRLGSKSKVLEESLDKSNSPMPGNRAFVEAPEFGYRHSQQPQGQHVTHRASFALGEGHRQQPHSDSAEIFRQQYDRYWQRAQLAQEHEYGTPTIQEQGQKWHKNEHMKQLREQWKTEQPTESTAPQTLAPPLAPGSERVYVQDYAMQVKRLHEENMRRLAIAQPPAVSSNDLGYGKQLALLEEQNALRLTMARQEQQLEARVKSELDTWEQSFKMRQARENPQVEERHLNSLARAMRLAAEQHVRNRIALQLKQEQDR